MADIRSTQLVAITDPDWLSPKQVAKIIGVSLNWLARSRSDQHDHPDGPPWYEVGGRVHYARAEIYGWLQTRRRGDDG